MHGERCCDRWVLDEISRLFDRMLTAYRWLISQLSLCLMCLQTQLAMLTAKPTIDVEALSPGDVSAPSVAQPRFGRLPGRRPSPRRQGPRGQGHCGHLSYSHTRSFRGSAATGGGLSSKGLDPAAQLVAEVDYRSAVEHQSQGDLTATHTTEQLAENDALSVGVFACGQWLIGTLVGGFES